MIINTLIRLKASGLEEGTLRNVSYSLAKLDKLCDITEPEQVKLVIANAEVANSYKTNLVKAYNYFAILNNIEFRKPKHRSERKLPNIPTRESLLKIVSAARKHTVIFKLLMETGVMSYELAKTTQKDFNPDTRMLSIEGHKGHSSRAFKLTEETTAMLKDYFAKYRKFPDALWMQKMWRQHRNALAVKLQDSNLRKIRLYDLRHYYATMLYAKTKDILLVKQQLGHKKIETTLIYTQLVSFSDSEEFYSATAKTVSEAAKLVEQGFDFVCDLDGVKLFRKRK